MLFLLGALPAAANTVATAVRPGPSSTATVLAAATAEPPATAVSHLSGKHIHMTAEEVETLRKWDDMGQMENKMNEWGEINEGSFSEILWEIS